MKKTILSSLIAATFAMPAFAADAVDMPPEPAPEAVYTQPSSFDWTGPVVGAQIGYGKAYADPSGSNGDGVIGGVHAGYNYDMGGYVVGAEVDYDATDMEMSGNAGKIDGIARAKAKVGADFGRSMLYGTAGGAYAHGSVAGGGSDDIGYAVGAGVDVAATDNVIVGGEYQYQAFDNFDGTSTDVNAHTFSLRAGMKF